MNIVFNRLKANGEDNGYFEQINDEAFPLSERMSFDEIFDFASDTNTDVLGIYDDKKPIGFVVLLKNVDIFTIWRWIVVYVQKAMEVRRYRR